MAFHQWSVVGSQLFTDYAAANGGRNPHINPSVLKRWQYGEMRGEANYTEEITHQQTFENWTSKNFLTEDAASCSQSLYLYPSVLPTFFKLLKGLLTFSNFDYRQSDGTYSSRELYISAPSAVPFGFSDGRVAVHARSPDMVIPSTSHLITALLKVS